MSSGAHGSGSGIARDSSQSRPRVVRLTYSLCCILARGHHFGPTLACVHRSRVLLNSRARTLPLDSPGSSDEWMRHSYVPHTSSLTGLTGANPLTPRQPRERTIAQASDSLRAKMMSRRPSIHHRNRTLNCQPPISLMAPSVHRIVGLWPSTGRVRTSGMFGRRYARRLTNGRTRGPRPGTDTRAPDRAPRASHTDRAS